VNVDIRIPACTAHHIQYLPVWAEFNTLSPPATQEPAYPESDSGPWIAAPLLLWVHLTSAEEEKDDLGHSLVIDTESREQTTPREEINSRASIPMISFDFSDHPGYLFSCPAREYIWQWHTLERS
jgi:hypothetical protein